MDHFETKPAGGSKKTCQITKESLALLASIRKADAKAEDVTGKSLRLLESCRHAQARNQVAVNQAKERRGMDGQRKS